MIFGLLSDIHYNSKPYRLRLALRLFGDIDILLIAGDIADRGTVKQFDTVYEMINEELPDIPVFLVPGNHDFQCGNTNYHSFAEKLSCRSTERYETEYSSTGAYCVGPGDGIDLFALAPVYYQKVFRFPEHGEQLGFLERKLSESTRSKHIVMCHPPLIAHNPQRTPNMTPYLPKEQDERLQNIVDRYGNIIFVSGHTHFAPTVERDEKHNNIYINDGSVCPTVAGNNGETNPGNIFRFEPGGVIECIQIRKPV